MVRNRNCGCDVKFLIHIFKTTSDYNCSCINCIQRKFSAISRIVYIRPTASSEVFKTWDQLILVAYQWRTWEITLETARKTRWAIHDPPIGARSKFKPLLWIQSKLLYHLKNWNFHQKNIIKNKTLFTQINVLLQQILHAKNHRNHIN